MTFNFNGTDTDFSNIFYLYLNGTEGYRLKVYKDIYGNPTVGLGHLISAKDNLRVGDVISDQRVLQLFKEDYDKLNIEKYVAEAADNYNQGLAIAHFVWGHGDGDYATSELRNHVINKDLDYNQMISYLNTHWDVNKPKNQKVNKNDFTIFYSDSPWQPSKDLSFYYNQISGFIANSAATSPIATYGIAAGALLISASFITWTVIRLRNRK